LETSCTQKTTKIHVFRGSNLAQSVSVSARIRLAMVRKICWAIHLPENLNRNNRYFPNLIIFQLSNFKRSEKYTTTNKMHSTRFHYISEAMLEGGHIRKIYCINNRSDAWCRMCLKSLLLNYPWNDAWCWTSYNRIILINMRSDCLVVIPTVSTPVENGILVHFVCGCIFFWSFEIWPQKWPLKLIQ
jgi:hypothetical protein